MIQWLGLCTSTAEGIGSTPGQKTKIPFAVWQGHKKEKKKKEQVLIHPFSDYLFALYLFQALAALLEFALSEKR